MRNTSAIISLKNIQNNIEVIKNTTGPNVGICAVIKADAYGHGMINVAKALMGKVNYLAVALVQEGICLRENKITLPILVLGSIDIDDIEKALRNNLTITVASLEKLEAVSKTGEKIGVKPTIHLKIDTGMGRVGVHWQRKNDFILRAKELDEKGKISCEGLYTHFSDSLDDEYTQKQFRRFKEVIDFASSKNLNPKFLHICSSRSIFLYPKFHLSMVRPGIAIYGVEPETNSKILPKEIKPAMELKTKVTYFKVITKGEYVSYGKTYFAKEDYERIATLPIGYADGYPRRLSNCGRVIIKGKSYPVVGRVCMDLCMVSLGKSGEAYVGDSVTLIGKDGEEMISAQEIASLVDTAPHEIITCISNRVPRVYKD